MNTNQQMCQVGCQDRPNHVHIDQVLRLLAWQKERKR